MFNKKANRTAVVSAKPKKKIKVWKIVALVLVLFLILKTVTGIIGTDAKNMLPMVDTAQAVEGELTSTLDTSGSIASEVTRVYASPVNALVGEVQAEVGENVQKGEFLLTYDTTSLQKSYDIAELQAKAEDASSNDMLIKSSESATDLATSSNDITVLQGQIDALNAEIAALQESATDNEVKSNNNASVNEKIAQLQAETEKLLAQISTLETKSAAEGLSDKEKEELKELKSTKKEKEKEIKKKEKSLTDTGKLANSQTNIQAQITRKNSQLADLESKLAEAEATKSAAEAGVLSDSAKANINYTQKASKLTLEQTAEDLSRAKAGVTADFDGIVTSVDAAAGTMAAEGTPLVTLASAKDMCVEILVSKYNLTNLKIGQTATVNFREKDYSGSVSYISKIATASESGAAMVMVKVHIDAPDDNLILGLDAKVCIDLGKVENVVKVPISAVNSDTTGDFVYVVEEGVVAKKYVTCGMASAEEMEIQDGLEAGAKVITTIDANIIEGVAVTENIPEETEAAWKTKAAE